jgi:hypothetical protein
VKSNREEKMSLKRGISVLSALGLLALNACSTTRTVVVRFEDLKSDFALMESSLCEGEWQAGISESSNGAGAVTAFHAFGGQDVRI